MILMTTGFYVGTSLSVDDIVKNQFTSGISIVSSSNILTADHTLCIL